MRHRMSLPVRGAWVEMKIRQESSEISASLPVRGAWVEMSFGGANLEIPSVAPRAGSVG